MGKYRVASNLSVSVIGQVMIWKGIAVLSGAAGVVISGVVALALITVPDEPTFAAGLEEARDEGNASVDVAPVAMGGQFEVSGAAEGTMTLETVANGPTFGLDGGNATVFFESDPLSISQMSYEGLAFFPDPDDCEFTEGAHNEETGLVAVGVSCQELVDIRDNGTISLEGIAALPADLVLALGIPDIGGKLTVGDEEWQITPNALIVGGFVSGGTDGTVPGFRLESDNGNSIWIGHDQDSDTLFVATIFSGEELVEVPHDFCTVTSEELMVINPGAQIHEMGIDCQAVEVPGLGTVPIDGTVVYEKIAAEFDH